LKATRALPLSQKLDILLAHNVALYDASIAAWDSKYYFMAERPTIAIRREDPNFPNWKAMGDIPDHPEYVSGHSAFSGAAAEILMLMVGDESFCSTSYRLWNLTRCFSSFEAAAREAGQSRIYGGIHFQFSNQDGLALGRNVAQNSYQSLLSKGVIKRPVQN